MRPGNCRRQATSVIAGATSACWTALAWPRAPVNVAGVVEKELDRLLSDVRWRQDGQ